MKINVGSNNDVKVEAVKELIKDYPILLNAKVTSVDVSSGVSNQPKSLDEIVQGAKNRATNAFHDCCYSFGIESGLIEVSDRYMDGAVCAVYDGKDYHLGLSSGFELPRGVIKLILKEDLDLSDAAYKLGLTKKLRIGSTESGIIGVLTKYRVTRKEQIKQAIRMALICLENSEEFKSKFYK